MTARHYSNSQNLVISFEYSWFLAKNLSNFVSLPWKLHNRKCHIVNCHNIGHPTAHIVRYLEVLLLSSSYVRMSKYFVHTQSLAGIVLLNLIFGSGGPPARKIKISNTNLFTFHSPFQSQCSKMIFNERFWPCSHYTFYHCDKCHHIFTVAVWTIKKFFPLLIRPQGSQGCQ